MKRERLQQPRTFNRLGLLRSLGVVYDSLCEKHSIELKRIGGKVPVGGSGWMDLFFKMEGIRGVVGALRQDKTLKCAIQFGKDVSSISVKVWNDRRGYQVHRWEKTAHDFIESTVKKLCVENACKTGYRRRLESRG